MSLNNQGYLKTFIMKKQILKSIKILSFAALLLISFGCSNEDILTEIEESAITQNPSLDECFLNCDGEEEGDGNTGGNTVTELSDYFYVHRGRVNAGVYFAESDNGTSWSTGQVGLGAKSSKTPASVIFNNNRFVFYKGNDSPNVFLAYKTRYSSSWQGNIFINNVSKTNQSVSAITFNGKIFVAYKGESFPNLFLAYSSGTGKTANYTQVQVSPGDSESYSRFSITKRGNTMYVFWSNILFDNGVYKEKLYYRTSTNPTNSNSWSNPVLLEEHLSASAIERGISTTTLNGVIYVTYGITETNSLGTKLRRLTLGKLSQNNTWSKTMYSQTFGGKAGIMPTDDGHLLLSFSSQSQYGGHIKTMKVNTSGTILTQPYNSGGEANGGGVTSHSKY